MDKNYNEGQEMMRLNYLGQQDLKKMTGEPAQPMIGAVDNQPDVDHRVKQMNKQTLAVESKKANSTKESGSDSCFQKMVIPIDNNLKSIWDILVLILIAYSCFTTTY